MISIEVKEFNKKFERECCICLKKILADETITKCQHYFHRKCLNSWFEYSINCPICRKYIENSIAKARYYIRIFSVILTMIIIYFFSTKFVGIIYVKIIFYNKIVIEFLFYWLGQNFVEISKIFTFVTLLIIISKIGVKVLTIIDSIIYNNYRKIFSFI